MRHLRQLERAERQETRAAASAAAAATRAAAKSGARAPAGPLPWPAPPPRERDRSRSPGPSGRDNLLAFLGTRPTLLYNSVINVSDGCDSPHEAFDRVAEGTPAIFLTSDAAKTSRTKKARRLEILSCDSEQFSRDDAALTSSHADQKFYVVRLPEAEEMARAQAQAPSPTSFFLAAKEGNVSYKQLSAEHQKRFEEARAKEANSLVSAGAVRVLSLEESRRFAERHPECILDSLWAERWKATDEKELLAKSRWCVVGWQDPDIHEIERSSPMPATKP